MRTRTARTASVALLKVMPFVVGVIMVAFCLHRGCGMPNFGVSESLESFGILWMPLLLLSSVGRGFCIWHRLLIIYDGMVSLLMQIEERIGFGDIRWVLNFVTAALGLYLLIKARNRMKSASKLANDLQENDAPLQSL